MDLSFGVSFSVQDRGNFPELPVINMFASTVPTEQGASLVSRPGLVLVQHVSDEPIRKVFKAGGVFNGAIFAVAGNRLYRDSIFIGFVEGDGPVSIVGFSNILFVCAGAQIYSYDGDNLSVVPFPDNTDTIKICIGASRMIAIRKDSQTFFWTNPLSTNIDALAFANAENIPDNLADALFVGNTLILFGTESVEFWPTAADDDLPYQPLIGHVFSVGIKNTGAATQVNSSFAWVTNENKVCLGDADSTISTVGLEERITKEDEVFLWSFTLEGNTFIAVRLTDETWVFSTHTQTWAQFTSYGGNNWDVSDYSHGLFASTINGDILEWSDDHTDLGDPFERRFRAWAPLTEETYRLDYVILNINQGTTPFVITPFDEPVIEMRTSKDAGNTWSSWKSRSMGRQGEFKKRLRWSGCGWFIYPGVMVEFRASDPVPFRVSKVDTNG